MSTTDLISLDGITHGFYINLDERTDRRSHADLEFAKVGISPQRFSAIKTRDGAIGCSLSHLKCIEKAIENEWGHVLICEDDITFTNPILLKTQLDAFLAKRRSNSRYWDVIILGGNNFHPFTPVDPTCIQVHRCQTTTGYIVNGHYMKTLADNIRAGLNKLIVNPHQSLIYAIDKYWFILQQRDRWYMIIPATVVQMPNYSDIEKRDTDYTGILTNINKAMRPMPSKMAMHIK
jgi:GR25 family glycosyltransferase involved in LPS biosynthesis